VVYCSLVRHHNDMTQPCFKLKSPCHVSHDFSIFSMVKCTVLIDLKKKQQQQLYNGQHCKSRLPYYLVVTFFFFLQVTALGDIK
jgi:hypothetical protein